MVKYAPSGKVDLMNFFRSLKFRMSPDFAPYVAVSGCDCTILLMRIKGRFRKGKKIYRQKNHESVRIELRKRLPYRRPTLGRFFCPIEKYETCSTRNPESSMKRDVRNQNAEKTNGVDNTGKAR